MKLISVAALLLTTALQLVSGYAIKGSVVSCRLDPGTSHKDKAQHGCYVSDYYVDTSNGYVAKRCSKADDKPKPKADDKPKPGDKPSTGAGPMKDNYPYKGSSCSGVDKWSYYKCQCVSFVAWRINSRLGIDFNNHYKGKKWGNANRMGRRRACLGRHCEQHTEDRKSVGQTDQGSRYRHVVWVAKVSGNSATIEEYNHKRHRYGTRTVPKSSFRYMPPLRTDALDDGFLLDTDLVADVGSEPEEPEQIKPAKNEKKRAHDADQPSKKKKKRKNGVEPVKFAVPALLDEQAAMFNKYMGKAYRGLSDLEMSDIGVQESHMYTTEEEAASLEDLAKTALFWFCAAQALRVLDVVNRMRPLTKRRVLKLFSRHIKIGAHKEMLAKDPVDIAAGTPNRVRKLLEDGDLKLNRLRLVVVDCWQDDKMRVIIDMDDTRADLFAIWRDLLLPASKNPDYNFKLRLL
ncbi:hypothetical protein DL89DRAFT_323737 [Linderina pennispora]|uniref:Peptidase C51 domain-containing protein n=1 Tax=Linderina pennispora TaxID=61395 RepID=A0A1Y1W3L3_9FUNG|nr:uncharacterized protein DL89DRAFT_323737 [Linderina pennispora]ORX68139.1 hypothetical protein DL89DRAFT_323737 [Linderina pennispora]